jgi:ABC-2 type transport system ATP-binding protein
MADQLIVIGRGRLIADMTVEDFIHQASSDTVRVRTPDPQRLSAVLAADGVTVVSGKELELLEVKGLRAAQIGDIAAAEGIALHELTPEQASLEEAFMRLTHDAVEYHASSQTSRDDATIGAAA